VSCPELAERSLKGGGSDVVPGVVGHDPFDRDPELGEGGTSACKKAGARLTTLVGQQLRGDVATTDLSQYQRVAQSAPPRSESLGPSTRSAPTTRAEPDALRSGLYDGGPMSVCTWARARSIKQLLQTTTGVIVGLLLLGVTSCTASRTPSQVRTSESAASASSSSPSTISPSWRPLPAAPIGGRIAAGAVWTGQEMIVWGGVARTGTIEPVGDGAAYDPTTRVWHRIAPAPSGVLGDVGAAAAWTGSDALLWAGNSPDGPAVGGMYDPSSDSWTRLPDGPLGPREGYVSVWTGSELMIIGGTSGDTLASPIAAAFDPRTMSWHSLRGLNKLRGFRPAGAVWNGNEVFLAGSRYLCAQLASTCRDVRSAFVAYDPSRDALRSIDLTRAPLDSRQLAALTPIGWTGDEVVMQRRDAPSSGLIFYNTRLDRWRLGSPAPCAVAETGYIQSAWLGDRFVLPCGRDQLQVYVRSSDRWSVIRAGPSPLNERAGSAIVWTGSNLIAWSGTVRRTGNPTPDSGAEIRLASLTG
jgi:hypothetical protein